MWLTARVEPSSLMSVSSRAQTADCHVFQFMFSGVGFVAPPRGRAVKNGTERTRFDNCCLISKSAKNRLEILIVLWTLQMSLLVIGSDLKKKKNRAWYCSRNTVMNCSLKLVNTEHYSTVYKLFTNFLILINEINIIEQYQKS